MIEAGKIIEIQNKTKCLKTSEEVQQALDKMAAEITEKLCDKNPIVIAVLTGSVVPTGQLITRLNFPLQLDYLHATRYQGKVHASQLHWIAEPRLEMKGRTVLIVEDVLDQGTTLAEVVTFCEAQGADQVYTATVVDKNVVRAKGGIQQADFTGMFLENLFLIGFGMDYEGYFRNLPGIHAVLESLE